MMDCFLPVHASPVSCSWPSSMTCSYGLKLNATEVQPAVLPILQPYPCWQMIVSENSMPVISLFRTIRAELDHN